MSQSRLKVARRQGDDWGGPYLMVAVPCLDAKFDGSSISIDSIYRAITIDPSEPAIVTIVFVFDRGTALGERRFTIAIRYPDSSKREVQFIADFVSERRLSQTEVQVAIPGSTSGAVWFDIRMEQRLLTRFSIEVRPQRPS